MDAQGLAKLLVESSPREWLAILKEHPSIPAAEIAESLQNLCFEVWTAEPQKVNAIAEANELIAIESAEPEVRAFADWTNAIKCLVDGDLSTCIDWLDRSESNFRSVNKPHFAAKTQPSKVYALALLGRYDEAVDAGIAAREVFVAHGDQYSAGKIEHNIGNLFWRRDLYRESEPYLTSAHERFTAIDDQRQLAMVENCQAFVKTLQNQFRDAEAIYQTALDRAKKNDLTVTEAEIEIGLSNLYLFEGRYDLALKYLEAARTRYEQLEMPNQSANCELEIADIYLELNLLPEAVALYEKAAELFRLLEMQAESARCSLNHARALIRQAKTDEAAVLLDQAEQLYEQEGNRVAVGSVRLARAQMLFDAGQLAIASEQADAALDAFRTGENLRLELFARWLRAEITAASGEASAAEIELADVLESSKGQSPEVRYLCHLSLGRLTKAEHHFAEAIALVESSRASLASEELRTTFFAARVTPYEEMVKLDLAHGRFEDAFIWNERARSRVLTDRLQASPADAENDEQLSLIREELNWLYNRIKRSDLSSPEERERVAELRNSAVELENKYAARRRRLRAGEAGVDAAFDFGLEEFRTQIGDAAFVEFAVIDGRYTAFVVTENDLAVFPAYADENEVNAAIKQFLFQLRSGRLFDRIAESNQKEAMERLLAHGKRIYDLLLEPLGGSIKKDRLIFAPAGILHYLPFHALTEGRNFLAERAIVSYAPSAAVLSKCLKLDPPPIRQALVAGVEDAVTPMVRTEIEAVSGYFENARKLIDDQLTVETLKQQADGCGVVHLACHGRFRPDNPGFSSLSLFAEELTVNEVFNLSVKRGIITLSACESGLNDVVRGEELVGLTSAFFAAGAGTLVLSLWRVNDAATVKTMTGFYAELTAGRAPAEALAIVQRQLIGLEKHPYFWSPFIVTGRG